MEIGDIFGGGIIFDTNKEKGLTYIVAEEDIAIFQPRLEGSMKDIYGNRIKNNPISICKETYLYGFQDWKLPDLKHLNLIYENLYLLGVGKYPRVNLICNGKLLLDDIYSWQNFEHFKEVGYSLYSTIGMSSPPLGVRPIRIHSSMNTKGMGQGGLLKTDKGH